MSTKSKTSKVLATFKHPMEIQVRKAGFEPLASVNALDLKRLSKGNHKIAIGFATGGCCQQAVYALVRNGKVADLEFEMCAESKAPVTKEMLAVLTAARKKIGRSGSGKWHPVGVSQFFRSSSQMSSLVISWNNWCLQICIPWGGALHCYYCCAWPPRCGSSTISTGKL